MKPSETQYYTCIMEGQGIGRCEVACQVCARTCANCKYFEPGKKGADGLVAGLCKNEETNRGVPIRNTDFEPWEGFGCNQFEWK